MMLYHCPACDRVHDEPYEAAFGLLARCQDCGLEADFLNQRAALEAIPLAA